MSEVSCLVQRKADSDLHFARLTLRSSFALLPLRALVSLGAKEDILVD
jgi:hypothetical protein